MNRRAFLTRLAAAAAGTAVAATVDWERLLWTPGATQYVDLWTPPTFQIGDLVAFSTANPQLTTVRDAFGWVTHQFAMVRSKDIRFVDWRRPSAVGVMTGAVAANEFAQVQVYGPTSVRVTDRGVMDALIEYPRLTHAVL